MLNWGVIRVSICNPPRLSDTYTISTPEHPSIAYVDTHLRKFMFTTSRLEQGSANEFRNYHGNPSDEVHQALTAAEATVSPLTIRSSTITVVLGDVMEYFQYIPPDGLEAHLSHELWSPIIRRATKEAGRACKNQLSCHWEVTCLQGSATMKEQRLADFGVYTLIRGRQLFLCLGEIELSQDGPTHKDVITLMQEMRLHLTRQMAIVSRQDVLGLKMYGILVSSHIARVNVMWPVHDALENTYRIAQFCS